MRSGIGLSRLHKSRAVACISIALLSFACCEGIARLIFYYNYKRFETRRQIFSGELTPYPSFKLCSGQPYLNYIPTPGYEGKGYRHNSQGYRGKSVEFHKPPGVARVLTLGGSTTYSWGVPEGSTYPELLEQRLMETGVPGFEKVEVINGGTPSATTAEMLNYYHFKFHYYSPDLVILNPGGNDARALNGPYYHPDYSDSRMQIEVFRPLPYYGRLAMRIRTLALLLIPLMLGPQPASQVAFNHERLPPMAVWYVPPRTGNNKKEKEIPDSEIAFKHNLESLIREAKSDGAGILLVPSLSNPLLPYEPQEGVSDEIRMLKEISEAEDVPFVPIDPKALPADCWLDNCHINHAGNAAKARLIAPYAVSELQRAAHGD